MKKINPHSETIKVYKSLGGEYLKGIVNVKPVEFDDFVKLLPPHGRVLDAGCAGGRDSARFSKKRFGVVGIDLIDTFLEEAKKNVPKAKFFKMDVRRLKFPANYFDAIWAHAILLHLEKSDIPKVLRSFLRILKPGGKLHIRVKRGRGSGYVREKLSGGKRRFFSFFQQKELEGLIKKAGFRLILSRVVADELRRRGVKGVVAWGEKP